MANFTSMNPLYFLSGYKTYIVGVAMIIYGYSIGDAKLIMEGLGFIFMRQAIAK